MATRRSSTRGNPGRGPKRDGSGRGIRANRGRGGCATTRKTGRGRR